MAKTRRGVDRITKQGLQAIISEANRQIKWHEHYCFQCKTAGKNLRNKCGAWWDSARDRHVANRAMEIFKVDESSGTDTLPGMEALP